MNQRVRRPWWHRFRFRLRTLMIAVGVVCSVLGWTIHRAQVQRDAVRAIQYAGGKVMYDWEWSWTKRGPMLTGPKLTGTTRWPSWLTRYVGIDYLSNVTYVDLMYRGSDELLEQIGQLRKLEYLRLAASPVSDAGLAHLEGLTSLRWLSLDDTKVTDAGLLHLKGLERLERLSLGLTRVSDAGLPHLKPLKGLKVLSLFLTSVSDLGGHDLKQALPTTLILGPGWAGRNEERAIELNEKMTLTRTQR